MLSPNSSITVLSSQQDPRSGHLPEASPSHKRRRHNAQGPTGRMCPHCGRSFKRTEHLKRHVRTHTKEKPFICAQCGAAFARRDLLTRHQRITSHEGDATGPGTDSPGYSPDRPPVTSELMSDAAPVRLTRPGKPLGEADADLAAAVSLSGMSNVEHWLPPPPQPGMQPGMLYPAGIPNGMPVGPVMQGGVNDNGLSNVPYQHQAPLVTPDQLYENGNPHDSLEFDAHFREFASFLDGVGLPAEWSPYLQFNGPGEDEDDLGGTDGTRDTQYGQESISASNSEPGARTRPGTPFSSWLPSAPTRNRIVSEHLPEAMHPPRSLENDNQRLYRISDDQRSRLSAAIESFRDVLDPEFKFPSRYALTRYLTSYFEGFHTHMPFIHTATWRLFDHSIELILGLAAVGAQYCFEHGMSERLYRAGKAIMMERLAYESERFGPVTASGAFLAQRRESRLQGVGDLSGSRVWGSWEPIEMVRTLIALMGYATWERSAALVHEAFALQALLAQVLRELGLNEAPEQPDSELPGAVPPGTNPDGHSDPQTPRLQAAWHAWVRNESVRRAKLIAFSFMHTHSIAYNIYPVLRSNEVGLRLPCSTREWKAASAQQWHVARQQRTDKQQLLYQDALSLLLRNTDGTAPLDPIPTPLGNYLLLHGLLQRIYIVRDLSLPVMDCSAALPCDEVDKLERGLRSWTAGWQQAPESSLDPNNENGPIPFTSSSLLGLAYVRIYLHLGPYRLLETRDPTAIARSIMQSPRVERSSGVITALLYTAHMLSIPVRLGVDRVARSQAFFWSVRHSLSGLECAVLLSKWLACLGETEGRVPLSDSEDRILHWVRCIVEEAYDVVDFDDGDEPEAVLMNTSSPAGAAPGSDRCPASLSLAILRIWAHFFKSNTQWPFINMIGKSLEKYRELLMRERGP